MSIQNYTAVNAPDIKLTIIVIRKPGYRGPYSATICAETDGRSARFYGNADSVVGAVEDGLDSIRREKRPYRRGRIPKRYDIARRLYKK